MQRKYEYSSIQVFFHKKLLNIFKLLPLSWWKYIIGWYFIWVSGMKRGNFLWKDIWLNGGFWSFGIQLWFFQIPLLEEGFKINNFFVMYKWTKNFFQINGPFDASALLTISRKFFFRKIIKAKVLQVRKASNKEVNSPLPTINLSL